MLKIRDDGWYWVVENPAQALYWKGTEDRILEGVVPLFAKGMDLFKIIMRDDDWCTTLEDDTQLVHKIAGDLGEILSVMWGFDKKFDGKTRKHFAKKPFLDQVHQFKHDYSQTHTHNQKIEDVTPTFAPIIEEVHDDLKEIKTEVKNLLHPPHHDAPKSHHKLSLLPENFQFPSLFPHHEKKTTTHHKKDMFDPLNIFFPFHEKLNHFF